MDRTGEAKMPTRTERQLLSRKEKGSLLPEPGGGENVARGDIHPSNEMQTNLHGRAVSTQAKAAEGARIEEVEHASKHESEMGRERVEQNPKRRRVDGKVIVSPYFNREDPSCRTTSHLIGALSADLASSIFRIEREMSAQLPRTSFVGGKVTHVYNPLEHAAVPHADYVRRYVGLGEGAVTFLLVGMNPGPWGMSQTGVPFGEVSAVRDWLGVFGEVTPPTDQHPQRLVTGFRCSRSEVSGRRFWGLWRRLCGTPDRLFRHVFIHNFCPLIFMERSGRNLTPNCLSRPQRERLEAVCSSALINVIQLLGARKVIGVGKYAEDQTRRALRSAGLADQVRVFPLLHPSPINPQANKDWDAVAIRQLTEAGLLPLLTSSAQPAAAAAVGIRDSALPSAADSCGV